MMNSKIQKLINIPSPILITGETGTGKSRLAREIFNLSKINKDQFVTAHLASLKEELFESELFGHKKGAFTGAVESKTGYLKEVGKGTLFLDEVGELSLESQKKLLYLLEEKRFTPIGSTHSLPFEGRIIMATNRNLEKMVEEKKFREDLYFRMNVFQVELDPINASSDKLAQLINQMFEELKITFQLPNAVLGQATKSILMLRTWKGNARELKNALEYALLMSGQNLVTPEFLPRKVSIELKKTATSQASLLDLFSEDYNQSFECFEKMYFESILDRNKGKVNQTARKLGISKTTLIAKTKKYGINTLKLRAEASCRNIQAA